MDCARDLITEEQTAVLTHYNERLPISTIATKVERSLSTVCIVVKRGCVRQMSKSKRGPRKYLEFYIGWCSAGTVQEVLGSAAASYLRSERLGA